MHLYIVNLKTLKVQFIVSFCIVQVVEVDGIYKVISNK